MTNVLSNCIELKEADNGTWYGYCSVVDDYIFSGESYDVAYRKGNLHFHEADEIEPAAPPKVSGLCTACGALETYLNKQTGTRDFSNIGESAEYPTGHGCELCA